MADNHDSSRRRHPLHSHQITIKTRPVSEIPSPPRFKVSLKSAEYPISPPKPLPSNPNPKSSTENGVSPSPSSLRRSSRRSSRNSVLGSEYDDDDEEDLDADDDDLREKPFKKRKLLEEVSAAESSFPAVPHMNKKRHSNNNNTVSPQIASDKNHAKNEEECLETRGSFSWKILEDVLDKLQKKDTYAVFAEPVDPEEVPGYYDFIKNPMDFGTMRKKIKNGAYKSFDTFQGDIYLICRNAMTYNAKDTVYYKQARAIQDAAKKILETVKAGLPNEGDTKFQQSQAKKLTSKRLPTSSDCTSGASLAASCTSGDLGKYSKAVQRDRVLANNGTNIEGQIWTCKISNSIASHPGDGRFEHQDYMSVSKILKRNQISDDNRRSTYQPSNNLGAGLLPVLMAFGGESQRMVPMGHQQLDFAYARSLARFSGDLGPVVWKVAAEKIRRSLPPGVPFGPGWVLEVPSNSSFPSKGHFNSQPHMQPMASNVCKSLSESRISAEKKPNESVPISKPAPDANSLPPEPLIQSCPSATGTMNSNALKQNSLGTNSEPIPQHGGSVPACVKTTERTALLQSSEMNKSVVSESQTTGVSGKDIQHTRRANMSNNSTSPAQKPRNVESISHGEIPENSFSNHPKILESPINLFGRQQSDDGRCSEKVALPSPSHVGNKIVGLTKEKKEQPNSLPPDLNVSLQSPVSNVPTYSKNLTNDHQPDLALQL